MEIHNTGRIDGWVICLFRSEENSGLIYAFVFFIWAELSNAMQCNRKLTVKFGNSSVYLNSPPRYQRRKISSRRRKKEHRQRERERQTRRYRHRRRKIYIGYCWRLRLRRGSWCVETADTSMRLRRVLRIFCCRGI